MCLSDTAEYWNDIKKPRGFSISYIHATNLNCGHTHRTISNEYDDISCKACIKLLETMPELKEKFIQNNGKRMLKHRRKKGYNFSSVINFGKYKGNTIKWIIENDKSYFQWLKTKILLHPELDLL